MPDHPNRTDETDIALGSFPGHLIRRLHQITVGVFTQEVGDLAITQVQFATLYALRHHRGVDQRTLSGLIALDTSTLGGVIDRLEARGLVIRKQSAADRRVRLLHLTNEGEALLDQVIPLMLRAQTRMLAPLTPEQRTQFMDLLVQLVTANNDLSRAPRTE